MGSPRILVVDDQPDLRYLLDLTLQIRHFDVVAAAGTCEEAVEIASSEQPSGVILDLEIPETPGTHAIERLKQACPDTKILIFSGSGERDTIDLALKAGADDFAVKAQESLDDLMDKLTDLVGSPN